MSKIIMRHQLLLEENGVPKTQPTKMLQCSCCPYGFHIDLDFVQYCESLANSVPSQGQRIRRGRRRQRKSMELMLGFEQIAQLEQIPPALQEEQCELEQQSPKWNKPKTNGGDLEIYNNNHSQETSDFVRDVLEDVCHDFERTLERTKHKDNIRQWKIDSYERQHTSDACISSNKLYSNIHEPSEYPAVFDVDQESITSNGSEISTGALQNIRQQMAISLNRMRDLEEQVKLVPILQHQLFVLKDEKSQLESKLKSTEIQKKIVHATNNMSPKPFKPQWVSPIYLDSLNGRLESNNKITEVIHKLPKRNVSTMTYIAVVKDIGVVTNHLRTRSIGTSNDQKMYTKQELEAAIDMTIEKQKCEYDDIRRKKLISVGTQMPVNESRLISVQNIEYSKRQTQSIEVLVIPETRDIAVLCKPNTRTIGCSENTIIETICEKCSEKNRTIGSGLKNLKQTVAPNLVSLKALDILPRSLTFSLGENEKLNIKRKTIGTQCQVAMTTNATQHIIPMLSKYCQHSMVNAEQTTDTKGLIQYCDRSVSTEPMKEVKKINTLCNTDKIITIEHGINTNLPPKTFEHGTSTEKIQHKDVACGDVIKPHILISCADNYCDSCKDTIKHLAREFARGQGTSPAAESRIPRPKTLMSPRTDRKLLRQNTYTVGSAESSPLCSQATDEFFNRLSPLNRSMESLDVQQKASLESVQEASLTTFSVLSVNSTQKESDTLQDDASFSSIHEYARYAENSEQTKISNAMFGSTSAEQSKIHSKDMLHPETVTVTKQRLKAKPNKEMLAALKVINDSLMKTTSTHISIKNANNIVQKEWFKMSSTDSANPLDVEDYLDCFEEFSNNLLQYMVNLSDSNGNTAMHYAVSHGNFDVVSIILDSKVCNVNQTNNAGYTCVMLVSLAKLSVSAHHTVVKRLFQLSDVNIRAKNHCQTALMLAVSHGNINMVQMLLEAGADINIQDEDGSTALMCAAEHGRIDIVKLLLAQTDCDSTIQDVDGSTALKISLAAGCRDIGVLLYAHEHVSRTKSSPYTSLRRKKKTF